MIFTFLAQLPVYLVCFRKVLAKRPFPLDQVRHSVQPETIDSEFEPELHGIPHLFAHRWIVIIQIWLMTEEAMPVIGLGNWVPSPIRHLSVEEDDSGSAIACVGIAPHIPVTFWIVPRCPRFQEPGVLIGRVVGHHLDNHPDATVMSARKECLEVFKRAVAGMN